MLPRPRPRRRPRSPTLSRWPARTTTAGTTGQQLLLPRRRCAHTRSRLRRRLPLWPRRAPGTRRAPRAWLSPKKRKKDFFLPSREEFFFVFPCFNFLGERRRRQQEYNDNSTFLQQTAVTYSPCPPPSGSGPLAPVADWGGGLESVPLLIQQQLPKTSFFFDKFFHYTTTTNPSSRAILPPQQLEPFPRKPF